MARSRSTLQRVALVACLGAIACGTSAGERETAGTGATGGDATSTGTGASGASQAGGASTGEGGGTASGATGGASAGGGTSAADNPDGYTPATTIFRTADYDDPGTDPPFELLDVADFLHEPNGGHEGSGAWRLTPHPSAEADPDEGLAGWKWWSESGIPTDSCEVLVVSYMIYLSQLFIDDVAAQNFPDPNYGINKIIDLQMWNADGSGADFDTRQIVQMLGWRDADQGLPAGGIYLAHVNGGAGGRFANDGVNVPLNLAAHPDEWIWIAHVFDARQALADDRRTTTYYKRAGDPGVTRSLVRTATTDYVSAGTYQYTTRGWTTPPHYNSALWGYWGDLILGVDASRFMKINRLRSGDGWIAPPF